jgi:hypothetical protein
MGIGIHSYTFWDIKTISSMVQQQKNEATALDLAFPPPSRDWAGLCGWYS